MEVDLRNIRVNDMTSIIERYSRCSQFYAEDPSGQSEHSTMLINMSKALVKLFEGLARHYTPKHQLKLEGVGLNLLFYAIGEKACLAKPSSDLNVKFDHSKGMYIMSGSTSVLRCIFNGIDLGQTGFTTEDHHFFKVLPYMQQTPGASGSEAASTLAVIITADVYYKPGMILLLKQTCKIHIMLF